MPDPYILIPDIGDIHAPESGIVSRTLQNGDRSKVIQFCFNAGQELSAHAAPFPATLYFVRGEATVSLGGDKQEVGPGAFVYMEPSLEHGIVARTEVVMLLTMLKNAS